VVVAVVVEAGCEEMADTVTAVGACGPGPGAVAVL
jgi:hypothetical protein